jgi:hypothetical protein
MRRNFCYGIYFNKFHAICKVKFQKCDLIYLAIHSHSALIFRLRCISIYEYKSTARDGRGLQYRLSNFWLAKEVNKELKKELLHQCL